MNRIKRMKKTAHSMTLKQVKSAARNYYFKESIEKNSTSNFQRTQKEIKNVSLKNHRNNISFESTNYKHSHFSELKQIIQIEINQLQSKILISEKNIIISNEFIKILLSHRYKNIKHLKLKEDSHSHDDDDDASFKKE